LRAIEHCHPSLSTHLGSLDAEEYFPILKSFRPGVRSLSHLFLGFGARQQIQKPTTETQPSGKFQNGDSLCNHFLLAKSLMRQRSQTPRALPLYCHDDIPKSCCSSDSFPNQCVFGGGCVSCERHTAVLARKSKGRRRTLPLPYIRWVVIREPQRELIIQTVGTTISAHMQARCQFLRHRADTSIS